MRPYHSASSAKLVARCAFAAALRYLEGLKDREIPWPEIAAAEANGNKIADSRQRAVSLGKEVHDRLGQYYSTGATTWHDEPGEIAGACTLILPRPEYCYWVEVESPIGDVPTGLTDGRPPFALDVDGVLWGGFRDLLCYPFEVEAERLFLPPGEVIQVDFKTSSDIDRWALTRCELLEDIQQNAYTIDGCRRFGVAGLHSRWAYTQTKRRRRSKPVDVRRSLPEAEALIADEPNRLARLLDSFTTPADAAPNPRGCVEYLMPSRSSEDGWQGGCPYHCSNGGPCEVVRSTYAMLEMTTNLRSKKPMADNITTDQQLAALGGGPFTAPPPPAGPPQGPGYPQAGGQPPAAPATGSRKKRTVKKTEPAQQAPSMAVAAAFGSGPEAGAMAIASELHHAIQERDTAQAKVYEIMSRLHQATGG